MKTAIIELLDKLKIKYVEEQIATGGWKYYFQLCSTNFCLFTSCWKDYGLHIVYSVQKRKGGKITEHFQKVIDYQRNLKYIEQILTAIVVGLKDKKNKV